MNALNQRESESLPRLGQLLLDRDLITPVGLDRALEVQRRTGDRLGSVLMSLGLVRRRVLYEVLAELWHCPFVDLMQIPPAEEIVRRFDENVLQEKRFVPIRLYRDGAGQRYLLLASSEQPTPDLDVIARQVFGNDIEISYFVTTDWDIDRVLAEVFREELLTLATLGLLHRNPEESAFRPFRRWQVGSVVFLLALLVFGLVVALSPTLILISGIVNACFLASILFKFATSLAGLTARAPGERVTAWHKQSADDRDLPTYTILVPVFREANIVGMLMDNLRGLDYPASKLEILLLIEEDDEETLEAAKAAQPPEAVTFIIVPRGQPQTKPRACNVGLFFLAWRLSGDL